MLKVFIIEDYEAVAHMYKTKFANEGFDVESAENGEIALEKLKSYRPDIILLDILMPEMSGLTVLDILKRDEHTADIPVLILTNNLDDQQLKRTIENGAEGYIIKSQSDPSYVVQRAQEIMFSHGDRQTK